MSSVVVDLENALQAMQNVKPPGVSGSKIAFITDLSVNNAQSESVIIQKLYTHFKKCPGTHKLGPLYVVDSIARRYLENAKKNHQEVSDDAPDGTHAAGVNRITKLLPSLMTDILQHAPPHENKDKIEKLYAIWERSSTFPPEVLQDIKAKMNASPMFNPNHNQSSTPPNSPPPHIQSQYAAAQHQQNQQPPARAPPPAAPQTSANTDVASMLAAIAQLARQPPATSSPPVPAPVLSIPEARPQGPTPVQQYSGPTTQAYQPLSNAPLPVSQPMSSMSPHSAAQTLPYTSTPPASGNPLAAFAGLANPYAMFQQPTPVAPPTYPNFPAPQTPQSQPPQQQPSQMEQLALLQLLLQQPGLGPMAGPALQALLGGQMGQQPIAQQPDVNQLWSQMQAQPMQPQNAYNQQQQQPQQQPEQSRGGRGYSPPPRSPPRYAAGRRGRTRSKSPERFDAQAPTAASFRRRSPVYGEYEGNDPSRVGEAKAGGRSGGRGRGGRVRSPNRRRDGHSPPIRALSAANAPLGSPVRSIAPLPQVPKNVTFDANIGPKSVRVLSRTLFVGGVTIGEDDLRQLFEAYGTVQSCIVNQDKRHAFIKMLTREDAVKAKAGMDTYRTDNMTLRTRWGVGFGPRDCSDYQTGESVIPIERLTEADQRWMVSAEYGGTGGTPLQGGMVVEEPDIEIGQGVSSKAISKRFPTDSGGNKGPRSTQEHAQNQARGGGGGVGGGGGGHNRRIDGAQQGSRENSAVAPPTPNFGGFPFAMPMMPPNMPAGFQYPGFPGAGQQQQQQQQHPR